MKFSYFLVVLAIVLPGVAWWAFKLKQIKRNHKTLIVGTSPHFPPFEYIQEDKLVGFDVDLMNAIAQEMDVKIEWHTMPFDTLIPGLQMGSIQVIAAGMTPTPAREQKVLFTKPYLSGDPLAIISLADQEKIENTAVLFGKTVVVNEGYTADFYASKLEGPQILRLETPAEAFLALGAKRADAFVASQNSVMPFLEKYGAQNYAISPIEGTNESSALAISKQHPELLTKIQTALDALAQKGIIEQLKVKWKLKFEWDQQ